MDYGQPRCTINDWQLILIFWNLYRTTGEEIAFTARPKIKFQSLIYWYGRSIFCLPHQPKISGFLDFCLHWVSVVIGSECWLIPNSVQAWASWYTWNYQNSCFIFVIRKTSYPLDYFLDLSSKLDETSIKFYGVTGQENSCIWKCQPQFAWHEIKLFFSRLWNVTSKANNKSGKQCQSLLFWSQFRASNNQETHLSI